MTSLLVKEYLLRVGPEYFLVLELSRKAKATTQEKFCESPEIGFGGLGAAFEFDSGDAEVA